ncbi:vacuolar amino acid transporter-like [Tropilaelaps mercedesae]|uniref:Vacuolar amino acid transporter-like n=1 Tax=Tropilaelaps mercedesae TaxID=418985 RepID=A0A1V9Y2E2_9ACAR|nr:vacuolar amino acid transporter-like [Tropilaelaps mercedesae]
MVTRRRKLEYLAYQTLGYNGKLVIELGLIFFLLGGCVALFVVAGDLLPALLGSGVAQESRVYLMVFLAFFIALPLSLRRNTESLTSFSMLAMMFYVLLAIKMLFDSLPALLNGNWFHRVIWWNTDNLLAVLPIFAMALAVVGFCGYIGQYQRDAPLPGNSLLLLDDDSWMSWMFKLGFVASLIMSFPLCLFPCRTSLHSVIYRRNAKLHEASSSLHDFIPENRFKILTFMLLSSTLGAALLIPRIELFLGITGATIGCIVCLVAPARIFLGATNGKNEGKNQTDTIERFMARFVVLLGLIIMTLCSLSMINRLLQREAFSSPELSATGKSTLLNSNAILRITQGFSTGLKNDGVVAQIVKQNSQPFKDLSQSIDKAKPSLAEKKEKRLEPVESHHEIQEVRTSLNKTLVAINRVKYHARDTQDPPAVSIVERAHSSRTKTPLSPNIRDVKSMNKYDMVAKPNAIVLASDKQQHIKAEAVRESQMSLPVPSDSIKFAKESEKNVAKKNKDEIKLLKQIAEVQQEQKKMIEDIRKELKQEIALHKEIKANHSKENDFVEMFEEKIRRIDKHIQEVNKMGNKTLKDIIETGNSKDTKMEVSSAKTDKQKPIEFKGPLRILNGRIHESAKKGNDALQEKKEIQSPSKNAGNEAASHGQSGQEIRRIESPLPIQLKSKMMTRETKNNITFSDTAPEAYDSSIDILLSGKIPVVPLNQTIVSPRLEQQDQQGQEKSPIKAVPFSNVQQSEIAGLATAATDQKPAANPKKPMVIPVEKPALLSEVTKDQGPALMKNLDKSMKQDKRLLAENTKPSLHDSQLSRVVEIHSSKGDNDELKKIPVNKKNSTDNQPQQQISRKVDKIEQKLQRTSEDIFSKSEAAPLAVKMNPGTNNVSRKEVVHKEI